jgi:Transposase DDE domain
MGYDNSRVDAECAERDVVAIIRLRRNSGHRESSIPRKSDEWRRLYRGRSAVEREFGRLKHHYGLAMLRVRGIERVRLHADLTIVGRLALELARARERDMLSGQLP